ncbi:MAG: CpsD/CapB family tyrosine-protein kinase [Negativicutes bacterium]|nr:CpsD/CapB family tyrosine-protein kinase [Negativicutes bacterium]
MAKITGDRYVIRDREQSSVAEAFRSLVSSLQEANLEGKMQTVLFTGAAAGDGAAMTAVNTAVNLAYGGKKVVLIDCDLRRPVIHEVFGLSNKGVSNIVQQGMTLPQVIQDSGIPRLLVLAGGPAAKRPIEVLSDPSVREMFSDLKAEADYVLINSSPLLFEGNAIQSDACVLAAKVDGVVLVLDSNAVRVQAAKKALELLQGARAKIIGSVLNDVKVDSDFIYHGST